ncbi:reverse transcriptase, partial [Operophtera brumata]
MRAGEHFREIHRFLSIRAYSKSRRDRENAARKFLKENGWRNWEGWFGTALETNLRDLFFVSLGTGPECDKLFEQNPSTSTLARAIALVEQAACATEAK